MKTDWRNLPAVAEGDRAVAEARGWTSIDGLWHEDPGEYTGYDHCPDDEEAIPWTPTTDIAQAFALLEGLPEKHFWRGGRNSLGEYFITILQQTKARACREVGFAEAPTLPLAICRAWLGWKEGQGEVH